jgi:hypothetical protein
MQDGHNESKYVTVMMVMLSIGVSRTNILLMVVLVWVFSFGLLLPPLLELWGSLGLDSPTFSCTILRYVSGHEHTTCTCIMLKYDV